MERGTKGKHSHLHEPLSKRFLAILGGNQFFVSMFCLCSFLLYTACEHSRWILGTVDSIKQEIISVLVHGECGFLVMKPLHILVQTTLVDQGSSEVVWHIKFISLPC